MIVKLQFGKEYYNHNILIFWQTYFNSTLAFFIGDINMDREEAEALADFKFANEKNVCIHAYVQITNDFVAGCILSQIFYWFTPDKNGKSKLRVKKNDGYWLAKSRTDWEKEICISPKQYDRAIKILKNMGLIETKLYKFNGAPMVHVRPIPEACNRAVAEWKENVIKELMEDDKKDTEIIDKQWISPKGKNPFSQKGKIHFDEKVKSITDTTTDTTNNNYLNNNKYNRSIPKRNTTHTFSLDIVYKQIDKVCDTDSTYDSDEIKNIFRYYFVKYRRMFGKDHPKMTTKNISDIIHRYYHESELSSYFDFDSITDMIDIHFQRDYGEDIDYNINHFMTSGILDRLAYEVGI